MSVWIGKTLGKVRIEKLLGRGGMAEVYYGTHTTLMRPVAVKILHGYLEQNTELHDRFQREARVAAGLRHPNIVQVFDFDLVDEQPYIVMEYINGPSLATYLRSLLESNSRLPPGMIAHLLPLLAGALDYAHSQGVIHRDVKPGNVLLYSRSTSIQLGKALPGDIELLLADFGLVRVLDSSIQTSSGTITGTPAYMSPEQARGSAADHRTDIYSLGVLLYELLSGRVPFEGDTAFQIIQKVITDPPAPIPGLSPAVQAVLDRALQKDPDQRFQSAGELSNAFLRAVGLASEANTLPPLTPLPPAATPATPQSSTVTPAPATTLKLPDHRPAWILPALLVIVLGGLAALAWPRFQTFTPPAATATAVMTGMEMSANSTPSSTQMQMPAEDVPASVGVLRFRDVAGHVDGATVAVKGMPRLANSTQYEVWLVGEGGETRRSLGVLSLNENGDGSLSFVDGQSRNLLALYDRMEITVEPSPDPSPNPTQNVAFSSSIPLDSLVHIRHLLVSVSSTPNQIALIQGLVDDTTWVDNSANAMLTAFDAGDKAAARREAEALLNLIVGSQSGDYGDRDNDGTVTDPGDGYGLLLNGANAGYLNGVSSHAQYAMQTGDAPEAVLLHGEHVRICIENAETWTPQLRDLALQILKDPLDASMRTHIVQAVALADKLLHGVDLDGNERIDPVPGEGGVLTAHEHSHYMADMSILPGAGQVMPPGPTPQPSSTEDAYPTPGY